MRIELEKILEKLGVDHVLSPYETAPWFHYDEDKGITCSAEVRMGPGGDDMEAEIQFIKDGDFDDYEDVSTSNPKKKDDESEDGEGETGSIDIMELLKPGHPFQILIMGFRPFQSGEWDVRKMLVKGEDYENKFAKWDEKGCDFFRACIEAMQMGELPDIEALIDDILSDDSFWGGGRSGKIGRKSPNIKPGQLLGMNKPGGM